MARYQPTRQCVIQIPRYSTLVGEFLVDLKMITVSFQFSQLIELLDVYHDLDRMHQYSTSPDWHTALPTLELQRQSKPLYTKLELRCIFIFCTPRSTRHARYLVNELDCRQKNQTPFCLRVTFSHLWPPSRQTPPNSEIFLRLTQDYCMCFWPRPSHCSWTNCRIHH